MNVPVSVKAIDCESEMKELLVADAVKFGALTASVDVVLLPIVGMGVVAVPVYETMNSIICLVTQLCCVG